MSEPITNMDNFRLLAPCGAKIFVRCEDPDCPWFPDGNDAWTMRDLLTVIDEHVQEHRRELDWS